MGSVVVGLCSLLIECFTSATCRASPPPSVGLLSKKKEEACWATVFFGRQPSK